VPRYQNIEKWYPQIFLIGREYQQDALVTSVTTQLIICLDLYPYSGIYDGISSLDLRLNLSFEGYFRDLSKALLKYFKACLRANRSL